MKLARTIYLSLLAVTLLSACTLGSAITPTPAASLPDLTVSTVNIAMQGLPAYTTNCVPAYAPYEVRATIQNLGQASAYNISVIELSTGTNLTIGELGAAQGMELYFPISSAGGAYNVVVDPQNTIPESVESNNTLSYFAITPTPPALCPPTLTPATDLSTPIPAGGSESTTLSLTMLFNGTYRSPDWGEFQLTEGIYYRTPPTSQESPEIYTTRIQDPVYYGDVNTDGLEDALVVLNTQNGGSGHFIELAVVLNQNGSPYNIATIYLGDRVVVESGKVENGTIVLNMRVQGPDDGLCCPSQFVTWNFVLTGDQLIKLP